MTLPVTRKLAVDCLLWLVGEEGAVVSIPIYGAGGALIGQKWAFVCPECGEPILPGQAIQFDHRHQHATGGGHVHENLRPVHYDPCHKKKSGRDAHARHKIRAIRGENKPKPKRTWAAGRKLQGRGFQKRTDTWPPPTRK